MIYPYIFFTCIGVIAGWDQDYKAYPAQNHGAALKI
jgi:hypothetical protein